MRTVKKFFLPNWNVNTEGNHHDEPGSQVHKSITSFSWGNFLRGEILF